MSQASAFLQSMAADKLSTLRAIAKGELIEAQEALVNETNEREIGRLSERVRWTKKVLGM